MYSSGDVEAITDEQLCIKSGPIRCSVVDSQWRWLVTAADDKKMRVWDMKAKLKMMSERYVFALMLNRAIC